MTLTCFSCPCQIAFPGRKRDLFAHLFGWTRADERYFCCACSPSTGGKS